MNTHPLRLAPGSDLREALEAVLVREGRTAAFVLAGIGSLTDARLRCAGQAQPTVLPGPSEILTLSGSLSASGAHLHMAVALPDGRVLGGHVVPGNRIRTTAEILLMWLPAWRFDRAPDPATGYPELVVSPREPS